MDWTVCEWNDSLSQSLNETDSGVDVARQSQSVTLVVLVLLLLLVTFTN